MAETAIITGGTAGLGLALVRKWLEEGWNVATCARGGDLLAQLRTQHDSNKLLTAELDVSDEAGVNDFAAEVISRWGAPQVLINNASILGPKTEIADYTAEEWKQVIDTNLNGVFYMTKAILPSMVEAKEGVIINISSGAGVVGKAKWGAYAASKFALEGFTQVLRSEVQDKGIRVHALDPGHMRTEMVRAAYPDEDPSLQSPPELIARVVFDIAVVYEPQLVRLKASDYL
jgi:NAD(P)-dependent dehydrogenase (short-subunit alcohol dehydrogenase family)